ncbi:contractile injection system tape measure protein [Pseudaestuariivita atlantica]|uniref:contractile injection system tape measure protein n=1 Tax=Pseudaestuariivita atlantica TaxID=1317121 RepID=UPI00067C500F|nr:contractile injection system tape measure protein [Pseudaestuariivita atlantica]
MNRVSRIEWHLNAGTIPGLRGFEDRVARFLEDRVPDIIDSAIASTRLDDHQVVIDRLDIDLGALPQTDFEATLERRLSRALRLHFGKLWMSAEHGSAEASAPARVEALAHYLHTGTRHWRDSGEADAPGDTLRGLNDEERRALAARLARLPATSPARARLVSHAGADIAGRFFAEAVRENAGTDAAGPVPEKAAGEDARSDVFSRFVADATGEGASAAATGRSRADASGEDADAGLAANADHIPPARDDPSTDLAQAGIAADIGMLAGGAGSAAQASRLATDEAMAQIAEAARADPAAIAAQLRKQLRPARTARNLALVLPPDTRNAVILALDPRLGGALAALIEAAAHLGPVALLRWSEAVLANLLGHPDVASAMARLRAVAARAGRADIPRITAWIDRQTGDNTSRFEPLRDMLRQLAPETGTPPARGRDARPPRAADPETGAATSTEGAQAATQLLAALLDMAFPVSAGSDDLPGFMLQTALAHPVARWRLASLLDRQHLPALADVLSADALAELETLLSGAPTDPPKTPARTDATDRTTDMFNTLSAGASDRDAAATAGRKEIAGQRPEPDPDGQGGDDPLHPERLIVPNAGIVLAAPFLPHLFDLLEMPMAPNGAARTDAQLRAVHLLCGLTGDRYDPPEPDLALNKLLCGVPVAHPVPPSITPTEAERDALSGLLDALRGYWTALSNTSVAALQETFLDRPGILSRDAPEAPLRLSVEAGPYDMLLDSLPWSISVIRHPWMAEALHVAWR